MSATPPAGNEPWAEARKLLEPTFSMAWACLEPQQIALSQAISLKRIADALEYRNILWEARERGN